MNPKLSIAIALTIIFSTATLFIASNWSHQQAEAKPSLDTSLITVNINQEPIQPLPNTIKLNAQKVLLGDKLFHDKNLSANNTISCSSCHNLEQGGTDKLAISIGINGNKGLFNAPTVFNSAFNHVFFWDGRATTLESQAVNPLFNPLEMGNTSWQPILNYLNSSQEYQKLFASIYNKAIDQYQVLDAIAEFERSLITPNSRFDKYLNGDHQALNTIELEGYQLFKDRGCISCHNGINIGGNHMQKAGIFTPISSNTDQGEPLPPLKVPSLRNIALTSPYFHDGSAKSLQEAVQTMGEAQLGIALSELETKKIVEFLNSLTGEYKNQRLTASQ